jgi:Family of unknown function (DUF5335)
MRTREIVQAEWKAFFDSFSRQHETWLVKLDVLGAELGAQHEVVDSPLVGISSDVPNERTVHVHVGRGSEHITHTIHDVVHVRLEQSDEGADAALQIEAGDGTTTLLQFRSVVQSESVDDIVPVNKERRLAKAPRIH